MGSFDAALVGKVLALVFEAGDDVGEIVVEFAASIEIGDDFFVFEVGILQALEGLFSFFC